MKQTLNVPDSDQTLSVEVSLVPAESLPDDFKSHSNVAKIDLGGKEFYAVVGKTGPGGGGKL